MKGRNRNVVKKSEHELLSYKKYKVLSLKVAQWLVGSLPVRSAGSTETTGYWKSPPLSAGLNNSSKCFPFQSSYLYAIDDID